MVLFNSLSRKQTCNPQTLGHHGPNCCAYERFLMHVQSFYRKYEYTVVELRNLK